MLIRTADLDGPFIPETDAIGGLQAGVDRVATAFSGAQVTRLDVAIDPASGPDPSFNGREAIVLGERSDDGWRDLSLVYVATPQLLAHYGYDLDAVSPSTVVITREAGEFAIRGEVGAARSQPETLSGVEAIDPGYESLPGTFVTTQVISERDWVTAPSGRWLVETSDVPTAEQLTAARELAAGAGLVIEVRDRQGGLGALQTGATAAGVIVALGIVATAVGLIRSETSRDLRILTAAGATRRTRRTLTAAIAGGLATLGVILGTASAYLGLTAGFVRDLGTLSPVPVAHLAALFLGLPLIATLAGWLTTGRGIGDIARQPME